MKQINKATLDEMIRLERKLAKTHDTDLAGAIFDTAKEISKQTFGSENYWLNFTDVVDGLVGIRPLMPNATNADIYRVFEAMGFEVVEEKEERHERSNEALPVLRE